MERVICVRCGEIVGVYEPARLVLADGSDRRGSRLTLGGELGEPGAIVVHERCYAEFERNCAHDRAE